MRLEFMTQEKIFTMTNLSIGPFSSGLNFGFIFSFQLNISDAEKKVM